MILDDAPVMVGVDKRPYGIIIIMYHASWEDESSKVDKQCQFSLKTSIESKVSALRIFEVSEMLIYFEADCTFQLCQLNFYQ